MGGRKQGLPRMGRRWALLLLSEATSFWFRAAFPAHSYFSHYRRKRALLLGRSAEDTVFPLVEGVLTGDTKRKDERCKERTRKRFALFLLVLHVLHRLFFCSLPNLLLFIFIAFPFPLSYLREDYVLMAARAKPNRERMFGQE